MLEELVEVGTGGGAEKLRLPIANDADYLSGIYSRVLSEYTGSYRYGADPLWPQYT